MLKIKRLYCEKCKKKRLHISFETRHIPIHFVFNCRKCGEYKLVRKN